MKRIFLVAIFLSNFMLAFSQSQGINYQAVIINQNPKQIPGVNISESILPNQLVIVRFTILDAVGSINYQEAHNTSTDAYGMINLMIGQGAITAYSPMAFADIDWNGTPKNLKVDISFSQSEVFFVDFSFQELTFIPYAYHKNITATGSLTIDGKSNLQDLTVEKTANLNGSLSVNNRSTTSLSGILTVNEATTLRSNLTVNAPSALNGQVVINADVNGDQNDATSYPLQVKGSNQGITISLDASRANSTNFILFKDQDGAQGRIEGESNDDITSDPMFYFENAKLVVESGVAASNLVAALSASTVCAGLGACVTAPPPSKIVFGVAQVVVRIAQIAAYNYFRFTNAGVVYKSKGADYAEYLPKENANQKFFPGDIVGVTGGRISLSTNGAERIMVVSKRPIVLGNMPKEGDEHLFEKIAFIGQVDTKVYGPVTIGDYIVPSGKNDGAGIAISPSDISAEQLMQITGVAWSASQMDGYSFINLAVGLHNHDAALILVKQQKQINKQADEIKHLKEQINAINRTLVQLLPNYSELSGFVACAENQSEKKSENSTQNIINSSNLKDAENDEVTYIYYDITRDQVIAGISMAQDILKGETPGTSINPLMMKIDADPTFKESFVNEVLASFKKETDKRYNHDLKSGLKVLRF